MQEKRQYCSLGQGRNPPEIHLIVPTIYRYIDVESFDPEMACAFLEMVPLSAC